MTIPYQMNCSHQGEGWCLACVGELGEENERLRSLLARCLPIVQGEAEMMADLSRHAPMSPEAQAKHDTTEYDCERLIREIPEALDGSPLPDHLRRRPEPAGNSWFGTPFRKDRPFYNGRNGMVKVGSKVSHADGWSGTVERIYGWPGEGWGDMRDDADGKLYRIRLEKLTPEETSE